MIYGKRIRFRAAERQDLPQFVAWMNTPEVRAGIAAYLPISHAWEENWFDEMVKKPLDEQVLVIDLKENANGTSWKTIGTCGFIDLDFRIRHGELGIMIGETDEWGKGYGTESVLLLLQHGFETLNLNRISLRVYEDNPGAIRAYEKAGFQHEGRLREAEFSDGEYKDVMIMSVLRSDWKP